MNLSEILRKLKQKLKTSEIKVRVKEKIKLILNKFNPEITSFYVRHIRDELISCNWMIGSNDQHILDNKTLVI